MTIAGWVFLGIAWTAITAALVFCIRLILAKNSLRSEAKEQAERHGPFSM